MQKLNIIKVPQKNLGFLLHKCKKQVLDVTNMNQVFMLQTRSVHVLRHQDKALILTQLVGLDTGYYHDGSARCREDGLLLLMWAGSRMLLVNHAVFVASILPPAATMIGQCDALSNFASLFIYFNTIVNIN